MTLKCLLTFSFIARHTFSIFCTPSATSHSCIEPKHCNQPVNICNQLLFLSTSSQSEISVHDKTLSERPQTFLLATVPIRSKDRVCWNHICVESFGARVQALLVWGWGGEWKGGYCISIYVALGVRVQRWNVTPVQRLQGEIPSKLLSTSAHLTWGRC